MSGSRFSSLTVSGVIVVAVAIVAMLGKHLVGGDDGRKASSRERELGEGGKSHGPARESRRKDQQLSDAELLIAELSEMKRNGTSIPEDLRTKASKLNEGKQLPYPTRIALVVAAFDERGAALNLRIMFKFEIAQRPFETIGELYRLVPEGPLQLDVADTIAQASSISPGDAPMAVEWLATLPDDARKRAVSLINGRLMEANDLETLKRLEESSTTEPLKESFKWAIQEEERERKSQGR